MKRERKRDGGGERNGDGEGGERGAGGTAGARPAARGAARRPARAAPAAASGRQPHAAVGAPWCCSSLPQVPPKDPSVYAVAADAPERTRQTPGCTVSLYAETPSPTPAAPSESLHATGRAGEAAQRCGGGNIAPDGGAALRVPTADSR